MFGPRMLWRLAAWAVALAVVLASTRAHAGRGWENEQALALAKEGIDAKKAGDNDTCIAKDIASLQIEEHPYVRLHISLCYAAQGKFKDALINARTALQAAISEEDEPLKEAALKRVQDMLPRIAKIKFEFPNKTKELKITMNGQKLRPTQSESKLTVDPGKYVIEAVREEDGGKYTFKTTITLGEGEEKTVEVLPKLDKPSSKTDQCLEKATNYQERVKCVEVAPEKDTFVHVGLEFSGYTDTVNVHVLSPAINFAVSSPVNGWNFGGSYLIDFVTAASPDIVSTASRRFREQRHAAAVGGGYKFGFGTLGVNGNVSSEPDYLSRTIGGTFNTELEDKSIVPTFGYHFSFDTIGYRNTPFSQFSKSLNTHAVDIGSTFVISPTTLVVTGLAVSFEQGENAKLYRFVPMFSQDVAEKVLPGLSVDAVNINRLDVRPRENVPGRRDRFAALARLNHRIGSGTVRVEERLYTDDWGIKASTTDGRFFYDLSERLRVWPHLRFHAQSGASFYQLAYVATVGQAGQPVAVPNYRTTDRELSPMIGVTFGGGSRLALTSDNSKPSLAIVVSGDVMYNKYFQSLFILSRTAVWGTVGVDAEF